MDPKDLTCGVCGGRRPRASCQVVHLTEQEKLHLKASGQEPSKEYVYCKPCWKMLANEVSGPAVYKGLLQIKLRQLGVPNGDQIAEKYHKKLVEMIRRRPS